MAQSHVLPTSLPSPRTESRVAADASPQCRGAARSRPGRSMKAPIGPAHAPSASGSGCLAAVQRGRTQPPRAIDESSNRSTHATPMLRHRPAGHRRCDADTRDQNNTRDRAGQQTDQDMDAAHHLATILWRLRPHVVNLLCRVSNTVIGSPLAGQQHQMPQKESPYAYRERIRSNKSSDLHVLQRRQQLFPFLLQLGRCLDATRRATRKASNISLLPKPVPRLW